MTSLKAEWLRMAEHCHWANQRVQHQLEALDMPSERARERMAHMLFAQGVWLERLQGVQTGRYSNPWPSWDTAECGEKVRELGEAWLDYLKKLTETECQKIFSYRNTKGTEVQGVRAADVISHVFHHSSYHRGQLATAVKQAGGDVGALDYIAYALENPIETSP